MENTRGESLVPASASQPVEIKENNSTGVSADSHGLDAANSTNKNEVNANDTKQNAEDNEKPKQEAKPPKPTSSTTVISCANCNSKIQEIEIQRGRDIEIDNLLNEALMTPFTMEVCDDDEQSDKITATVEISVFEALIELFALRNKSPHLVPLLEKTMKTNSIDGANALGLGSLEPGKQVNLLSLCTDCTSRIANLYELYKEFTLLSMKSNSFFSRILGSSASGAFAKTNIKTVPVPKSVQQMRSTGNSKLITPVIPEVIIGNDNDESMDYSANQTYSDNEDMPYTMDVETVYGETPKITSSRGRSVTDNTSKGSGMFNEAAGSGSAKRGDSKRTCNRCGKVYYYTASFEKHHRNCTGPDLRIGSVSGNSSKLINSDEEAEEISILPDIHIDTSYNSSGSGSYSSPQTRLTLYKCKYCETTFQSITSLQKHERTHGANTSNDSSTVACKPCGRHFGSVYDLRRHYQTNAHKQRIRDGVEYTKSNNSSWNY